MASQTSVAVVAEKPSVARDIARVLKATTQGKGYLHGNGYVVTWAIGHLVALAQPHEIKPQWRSWRLDLLPMLPEDWPLVVGEETKDQFQVVRTILTSPRISSVICATDAGREGELIFRYIYEAAGSDKPVQRLWISSLTPDAILHGLEHLRPGADYDPLADAARGRSRADWLVGMNLSRAYTLAYGEDLSVGRVQTPTLAMLVERELAIRSFVPEDYLNVVAKFSPDNERTYEGTWFRQGVEPLDAATRLQSDGVEAKAIVARVSSGKALIESIEAQTKRMGAPLLYDLTELQRHANRLYGFSAQRTLELAQNLYERHKLLSYPRTDSRHLSLDVAKTLPNVVRGIAGPYQALLAPGTGQQPLGRRFVDDTKVSDHHAIIPTGVSPEKLSLSPDEQKIFDLVCRRLLSAWHEDYIWSVTTVITLVRSGSEPVEDRFHSTGTAVQQEGWKVLDVGGAKKPPKKKGRSGDGAGDDEPGEEDQQLPPNLEQDQPQQILEVESIAKRTRPPKRFTEGTLLTAMETAGKALDDKELSDAMKESGLGTPATRAQIIEVLLKRGFIERRGKSLEATEKGIRLIDVVHPEVKSPIMTGQWEAYLKRIERGKAQLGPFLHGIKDYVREVIGKVGSEPDESRSAAAADASYAAAAPAVALAPRPSIRSGSDLDEILREAFHFESFRPNQEPVCRAVMEGRDVLLVMPTGSGKSLCYQLPGIALGGTTLVVSPLIALIEDQIAKLNALGFHADRIHSGRDRGVSRQVCFDYLEGKLDFLFIAPERLRVQGFPEMLAKHKPSLIAIDEAHCISQWGHDFRPDYRNIGRHLPALRPAPVIALTATATPLVQTDIARQLGLRAPRPFIHGFRRDNIAIEVVKIAPGARHDLARSILLQQEHRPAIIYTPRRRDAEVLARDLERDYPAAAYHAGLEPARRRDVQERFLDERLEVIVATIAFGMGIDKPNVRTIIHTALPGSVEGYYQEIGRAGRDGHPSRAILMHSYADRYTHDFFYERAYPDPEVVTKVFQCLSSNPQPKDVVRARVRMNEEAFDVAMEKLWIHGGAIVDYAENLGRGSDDWLESYIAQREHKMAQFEKIISFCETASCRMLSLVRYFGDAEDSRRPCGTCDVCDQQSTVAQTYREAEAGERKAAVRILEALRGTDSVATGRLHAQVFADGSLDRRAFEELLGAMARSGMVELAEASFEKDGRRIEFRKARITPVGRESDGEVSLLIAVEAESEPRPGKRKKAAVPKTGGKRKRAVAKAAESVSVITPPIPAISKSAQTPRKQAVNEPVPQSAIASRNQVLEAALKAWRLTEAKSKGMPAFRIMTDKVLQAIAARRPQTTRELLSIPGMGLNTVEKYGSKIFHIIGQSRQ